MDLVEKYLGVVDEAKAKKLKFLSTPQKHQLKIAIDTVKNPNKGKFLGGPDVGQAKKILKDFGYSDAEIKKLEG